MSPRHVLYIQPNSEVGGSDIALARTIEAMGQSGQRSSVILPKDGPLVARLRAAGAEVHFLEMKQLRTLPSVRYQSAYLLRLVPTVIRLRRMMRQIAPDLVHSNSAYCLYGAFAARLAGLPHVWHVREMAPQVAVLTRLYAGMVRRLSTVVLAMSDACLEALYGEVPEDAVVMPDALDADAFRAVARAGRLRAELGIDPNTRIVGFAARLDPWKGADVFLNAAARVCRERKDVLFLLAGGAPAGLEAHEAELHAKADELGLGERVRFLGWRYRMQDMADVMEGFDIFCHTSVVAEPFGLVLLEAMAMGTPVIASAAGGPLSIIEDGVSGLLCPPGQPDALALAILELLDDPDRARRIGAAGRSRQAQAFSVPAFITALTAVYDLAEQRSR
ncbi:glycosyltransferase [Ruegeria marina]|uniref:Glycosyltransferase involved in cell wall bisynthesis n=1 Tax=Ruegeria marina TaxID=639004 RepID=A0A1G6VN50_9RHOB|nr:glycosyltransferase [Ruegeria marina]SDD54256.1 Glycosyltransferase involved in cell wall bisynthesis [Ruegeria marina]